MCWKCGKKLDAPPPVSRFELCPVCGADVRCCFNCRFYEKGAPYDCREKIEEPVRDKERSCFCTWFSLNPDVSGVSLSFGAPAHLKAEQAKKAFNGLFGDNCV